MFKKVTYSVMASVLLRRAER